MMVHVMTIRGLALCLSVVVPLITAEASSGVPPQQPRNVRPYLPGYRTYLTHRHGWHRVDYRVNAWVNIPAANRDAANTLAKQYRSHGWTTQIAQPSKGVFIMKAKMNRWQLATYSANLRTAEGVAILLRSQGYQARVAY